MNVVRPEMQIWLHQLSMCIWGKESYNGPVDGPEGCEAEDLGCVVTGDH